ncbi:MAG: hypothetical protein H7Z72_06305 [Bacteroidetes bacterium]|nr:hypothetical protein [Fibrella sp.]
MTATTSSLAYRQTTFQIIGFDRPAIRRLNFVGDVTNSIPQGEQCRLTNLSFEVNAGVRVDGWLTVRVQDERQVATISRQLQAVRGLVSVKQLESGTN